MTIINWLPRHTLHKKINLGDSSQKKTTVFYGCSGTENVKQLLPREVCDDTDILDKMEGVYRLEMRNTGLNME